MNTLLLHPSDVLFFKDGRPMSGSLSGHGAAWPLPTVINAALHAALHRAEIAGVHGHDHHRSKEPPIADTRKFGSLLTAGPFPVDAAGNWYFPRPLDANGKGSTAATFLPIIATGPSSLPQPLQYPVANSEDASKETPAPWWDAHAWTAYLSGGAITGGDHFKSDAAFSEAEHTYGIGIDPDTATQNGDSFYSASYLRLKPGCSLGLVAEAQDKIANDRSNKRDLIEKLFPHHGKTPSVIVGGQQRVCSVECRHSASPPFPVGQTAGFTSHGEKWLVKWILLTPAIFPEIGDHNGGWLPSWIRHTDGKVMLKSGDTTRGEREGREAWRKRIASLPEIAATLVAAMTGKPLPITGYALPNEADPDRANGGAKSTHLAVPAGSAYYFTTSEPKTLAAALNWHGASPGTEIQNRRSTLMGEKGFGLGACSAWSFHPGDIPGHP